MRLMIAVVAASAILAAPARALTCEALVLEEAIVFSKGQPKEKWFKRSAATPEENARAWLASPKGQEQIARDRARKRKGCV